MTEIINVTCEITKQEVPKDQALEYILKETEEKAYVSATSILEFLSAPALLGIVLDKIAQEDSLYTEVVSIRKQVQAKINGQNEGATKALQAIQNAAKELGVDLTDVLEGAFPSAKVEKETPVAEEGGEEYNE